MIRLEKIPEELKHKEPVLRFPEGTIGWWFETELPAEMAELALLRCSETRSDECRDEEADSLADAVDCGIVWDRTPGDEQDYWPWVHDRAFNGEDICTLEEWRANR